MGFWCYIWLTIPVVVLLCIHPTCALFSLVLLQGKIQHKSLNSTQNGSLGQSGSQCRSFSITQMVEEGSVCFERVCSESLNNCGMVGSDFVLSLGVWLYLFCLQMENRFSSQSKQSEIERRSGQRSKQTVDSRDLRVCATDNVFFNSSAQVWQKLLFLIRTTWGWIKTPWPADLFV